MVSLAIVSLLAGAVLGWWFTIPVLLLAIFFDRIDRPAGTPAARPASSSNCILSAIRCDGFEF